MNEKIRKLLPKVLVAFLLLCIIGIPIYGILTQSEDPKCEGVCKVYLENAKLKEENHLLTIQLGHVEKISSANEKEIKELKLSARMGPNWKCALWWKDAFNAKWLIKRNPLRGAKHSCRISNEDCLNIVWWVGTAEDGPRK